MSRDANELPLTEGRHPPAAASVSEEDIRRLVVAFYESARGDGLIGPIFDGHVADWDAHFDTMCDFWSSAVLKTGRYSGRPAAAHFGLGLTEPHFDRWLAVWEQTARRELGAAKAEPFVAMGRRMAEAMMNVTGMVG